MMVAPLSHPITMEPLPMLTLEQVGKTYANGTVAL